MPIYKDTQTVLKELKELTKQVNEKTLFFEQRKQEMIRELRALKCEIVKLRNKVRYLVIENIETDSLNNRKIKKKELYEALERCIKCSVNMSGEYESMKSKKDPKLCYSCAGDDEGLEEEKSFIYRPTSQI